MGEVYRARDMRLQREVAIKVLPQRFVEDEERLQRFEREARSLASLNHPNVAQVFGVDQVDDTCFMVMELVPGEELSERLARGALPLDEALDLCRQLAEGLEAAHEAGVIHRDLKPANVRNVEWLAGTIELRGGLWRQGEPLVRRGRPGSAGARRRRAARAPRPLPRITPRHLARRAPHPAAQQGRGRLRHGPLTPSATAWNLKLSPINPRADSIQ
jgi:hypothetical protein